MPGIQFAAAHQIAVYVVEAHCPRIRAANAAELKRVSLRLSHMHVFETLGCLPNNLEKGTRLSPLFRRHFVLLLCGTVSVLLLRHGARRTNVYENKSERGILQLRRE